MKLSIKPIKVIGMLVALLTNCAIAHADITIYIYGTSSAPHIQLWNADADISSYTGQALPETGIYATGVLQWYSVTLSGVTSTNMAFTTTSAWDNQTSNITGVASGTHYYYYEGNGFYLDITSIKEASQFCFFEPNESWWYNDYAQTVIDVYTSGATIATKESMTQVGGMYNGNNIFLWTSATTQTPTGVRVYRQVGSNYPNDVLFNYYSQGIFYKGPTDSGSYTKHVTDLTWPEENDFTGELYLIGQANGNPWQANVGIEMTATNSEQTQFKAEKVLLTPGNNGFAFATMLGASSDDWSTLNAHRYGSTASSSTWLLTESQLGQWQSILQRDHDEKNFVVSSGGYYDVEVDLSTMSIKLTRTYDALYMYYGDVSSEHWRPNAGVNMQTTDGITYTLSNVELSDDDTFQFTKQLSNDTSWPTDHSSRIGANSDGTRTLDLSDLNKVLDNALKQSTSNEEPNDFKMDENTGGTYRVVVNLNDMSVALYNMATIIEGKTIIHLEQTGNITNPKIWAYDKEKYLDDNYIHEDRPSRDAIAQTRKQLLVNVSPNSDEVTTADGRKWWTWEVNDAMTDFWFTRDPYTYNPDAVDPDDENADMTDINWRKAGEIYLSWPSTGTSLANYTRDYYAAAAQEAADCAVMIEGHLYAYFTNTPGWDNVFCHAWYTDDNGVNHDLLKNDNTPADETNWFPGAPCELVGYDKDGYEVWRIDLTNHGVTTIPVGIIFNNGISSYGTDIPLYDYATGEITTKPKEQTSDFVYSNGTCYDYCGVIVLGRSLGNIIRNGVIDGPVYTIEEDLVVVYLDKYAETQIQVSDNEVTTVYGALYCKDNNNFVSTNYVEKSLQQEGEIDYIALTGLMGNQTRYDQSNWVKLTLSTQYPNLPTSQTDQVTLLEQYVSHVIPANCIRAQLVDNFNPEMRLALQELPAITSCPQSTYNPNLYVTANFIGSQNSGIEESTARYFLVTPKPQEFATITWAVYGGNNEFFIPTRYAFQNDNGKIVYMNEADLNGYFSVNWDLMEKPDWMENGVNGSGEYTGQAYKFEGIIRLAEDTPSTPANAPRRENDFTNPSQPYKHNVTSSRYIVSPINISNTSSGIVTSVSETKVAKTVKRVRYYNVAGIESTMPFDGMNIIVTEYNDGTKSTRKEIKNLW